MPKIFISHAHADKDLIEKFVEVILDLGCGVPRDDVFCTSCLDKGIQEGKNFIDELKKHLKDAPLVILMLSPNYFNSQFCLGELGATWVLDCDIFPIVIPDIEIGKVQGILQVTHMGMIDNKDYLGGLHDILVPNNPKTGTWNKQCTAFVNDLPVLLASLPKPQTIPYAKYEALQNELENVRNQIREQQQEIRRLQDIINQIENEPNHEKVRDIIFRSLPLSQQFDQLIENAKDALSNHVPSEVRNVVGLVLFYWFTEGLCFYEDTKNWDKTALENAKNRRFIIYAEDDGVGTYTPNETKLRDVIAELEKLFEYNPGDIDYENDPFITFFSDNYGCEFIDKNGNAEYKLDGEFWKNYLGVKFPI